MSATFGILPFAALQFDKHGRLTTPEEAEALEALVREQGITDLFVAAHGWQNDAGTAFGLYQRLFTNLSRILAQRPAHGRKAAVAGIFWPSKPRYQDYGSFTRARRPGAGGAASAGGAQDDVEAVRARLEDFKAFFEDDPDAAAAIAAIDEAAALADRLGEEAAQDRFVALLRSAVTPEPSAPDEDRTDRLVDEGLPGRELLARLRQPTLQVARRPEGSGGAMSVPSFAAPPGGGAGGAAGLFQSIGGAAQKLVDQFTYSEMNERAGVVGLGLARILAELRRKPPGLRVHLVGHSFGARLVTSAAGAPDRLGPSSLTLLQAAFSHHAFSASYKKSGKPGFFRPVVGAVRGPIVITHTANDDAVGVAYPIASKLAGQEAASIGGPDSLFGALGRNGAVDTLEAIAGEMRDAAGAYALDRTPGRIYNLRADEFIRDREGLEAHGDVTNADVANVVAGAAGF